MNEPISEMDKQLRDTPEVNLVVAIMSNKGKRNVCLFLGIIALAVILLGAWEFGWSKWLLLLPAALGIGAFLYQMNILIVWSELRRRSKPEETETFRRLTPEEIEERKRRLEFMESHQELIVKRAAEYGVEHPDESPEDAVDIVAEECFLEHEIAELKRRSGESEEETSKLTRSEIQALQEEREEAIRRLAFMENHPEIIEPKLQEYLATHPDDSLTEDVVNLIVEKCFVRHEIAELEAKIAEGRGDG